MKGAALFLLCFYVAFGQDDQVARLKTGNRLSAPNFYKEIVVPQKTNLMFSTFSAEMALLFLYSGSGGNTAEQILSALQLKLTSRQVIETQTKILIQQLTSTNLTFDIANALFVQQNYKIKKSFTEVAENIFQALAQNVDFANNVKAAKEINDWVANKTHEKITDLLDKNSLGPDTKLVLVNALYFQGDWTYPFSDTFTKKPEIFYKSATETVETNYMSLEGKQLKYSRCGFVKAHFLELPIKGGDASMVIVVPENRFGLDDIEKHPDVIFTPRNMTKKPIKLKLPSFLIRSSFTLIPALKKLGILDAFGSAANLTGIANDGLSVTGVVQKTYIKVDKNGIEAAAATAVIIGKSAILDELLITVDHPFIFYIKVNDFIIFVGKVYDPTKEE